MARTSTRPRRSSPFNLTSSFGLFSISSRIVRQSFWVFAPLYAVLLIFAFHSWIWTPAPGSDDLGWWRNYSWLGSGFSTSFPTYAWYSIVGFSLLWLLFVLVAGTATQVMAQKAQLELAEGQTISFAKLWATVKELSPRMFGLYLLILLYVSVGLILFIIPGLIMLRRYFLAPYVMLDKKASTKDAMERSAEMTKHYSGSIWGIIAIMVVIGLLNVLPYVGWLLSFILGALYSVAPALRYHELKKFS